VADLGDFSEGEQAARAAAEGEGDTATGKNGDTER
jgi:hypothetical protein